MSNLFEIEGNLEMPEAEAHEEKYVPQSQVVKDLMKDPKIIAIADSVDTSDPVKLYDLGKEPSDQLTEITKSMLDKISVADTIGSNDTLNSLTKIANQIDFKELTFEKEKGLKGLLHRAEDMLRKRVAKYQSIGGEVQTLFLSLKTYEGNIQKRIDDMDKLAKANSAYAKNLDQYIALLYILRNRQDNIVNELQLKAQSGDDDSQIELPNAQQVAEILDKRTFDLEQSKVMATMTAPQIKQTQDNNLNLIQQYHSAFIMTIPALHTGLLQAVNALQQNYSQQGLNAQKAATAELMQKNAERLAINNKFIAESSGQPMVSIEQMQSIVSTIVNSVQETKVIEEANKKKREESRVAMNKIVKDFNDTVSKGEK